MQPAETDMSHYCMNEAERREKATEQVSGGRKGAVTVLMHNKQYMHWSPELLS